MARLGELTRAQQRNCCKCAKRHPIANENPRQMLAGFFFGGMASVNCRLASSAMGSRSLLICLMPGPVSSRNIARYAFAANIGMMHRIIESERLLSQSRL